MTTHRGGGWKEALPQRDGEAVMNKNALLEASRDLPSGLRGE